MSRNETTFNNALAALNHHVKDKNLHDIRQLFTDNPNRFADFSLCMEDLVFDFSKCALTIETLNLLKDLCLAADVIGHRDAMYEGIAINKSENRPVLHIALRANKDEIIKIGNKNVVEDVHKVLSNMEAFCESVRDGSYLGYTGEKITDIVNIGIGGSDLGPDMVTKALEPYHNGPRCHFVSNVDGAHIADILGLLNPQTTLIIIASKTFTTAETMTNAAVARRWISESLGELAVTKHFAAVSTALDKIADFGIDNARVFGFWNFVGGRYSVWSAIGLSVMMAIGGKEFGNFLKGAHAMDEHFKNAPIESNLPIILGLIGFYHRVICDYCSRAIIPYEQRLLRFPAYLQQLDMESNGKNISLDGKPLTTKSGPIVFGEPGTNGQHAFFQLLHQGSDIIPVEFIISVHGHEPHLTHQHNMLVANCLAQSEALMIGRQTAKNSDETLPPYKTFSGNRPSITLMHDSLTPYSLGRLIALYEHRVFVEGVLMNINSFDQWGVELGKELANELLPMVSGKTMPKGRDSSTIGLLTHFLEHSKHTA